MSDEAPYLEDDTDYFHETDDAAHVTDGTATPQSPESDLVLASQGHPQQVSRRGTVSTGTAAAGTITITNATNGPDGLELKTNAELTRLAKQRVVPLPKGANKAKIVAALRGADGK